MTKDYVLGTDQEELIRLKRQHELWKLELLKLWQKSGFGAGHHLLDLGCGPGYTTRDLARWIGGRGSILAVDASKDFLHSLTATPAEAESAEINVFCTDLIQMTLQKTDFDGAFCRWLMIFVKDYEKAIQRVHLHLKPHAKFVLQEYIAYDTMSFCPEEKVLKKIVEAIFKSWQNEGGSPNRGKDLPRILEKNGFKVLDVEPIAKVIRPNDPLWAWPEMFYRSFVPRLVHKKIIDQNLANQFFNLWNEMSKDEHAFYMTPTLVNIIAEKKTS